MQIDYCVCEIMDQASTGTATPTSPWPDLSRPCCIKCAETEETSKCYLCKKCLQEITGPCVPIRVFVDHANIWIGAKKRILEDHRIRISYKKLRDLVAGNEDMDGKVYTTDKLSSTGEFELRHIPWLDRDTQEIIKKQKMVDTTIVRDILELKITVPSHKKITVVILSGDADMIPALEDIAKVKNWEIKIYSWEHCRAAALTAFQRKYHSNVSIVLLDEFWDRLIYRNYEPTDEDYKINGVVLTLAGNFSKDEKIEVAHKDWWEKLETKTKCLLQYKWLQDTAHSSIRPRRHLLLVVKGMKFSILQQILKPKDLQHVEHCESFREYNERLQRGPAKRVADTRKLYSQMARKKHDSHT